MRCLSITRKKSFFGALITYYCIVGIGKSSVDDTDTQYPIKNGQTIDISIDERECAVVVGGNTSTGTVISFPFLICTGTQDITLELVTKFSWKYGSSYVLLSK